MINSSMQVDGVEQLVSGEGPSDFRLPATLQQYVEHGGCLFKVVVDAHHDCSGRDTGCAEGHCMIP